MVIEVNIALDGFEELKDALQRLDSSMQTHVGRQLANWARNVKALAEQLVPVRTGRLRGSIYAKVQGWNVDVGAEAPYALSVEFGTRHNQARPFLFSAVSEHLPRLEQVICDAIDAAKTEAGLT